MGYCVQMTASVFSVSTENTGRVLAIMKKYPYRFELDSDGNISGISYIGCCLSDEYSAFQKAAQYILNGSYIEMRGEDGDHWRWVFQNGVCNCVQQNQFWNAGGIDHGR